MGLGSVMQTALSGVTAATTSIDAIANNLANSRTPGFKTSRVRFSTQPYQTFSVGSGPMSTSGGANPIQVGRGVQIAGITADFSQGPIELSDQPALLALQGEGFFILEGNAGGQEYTRDGTFSLNSAGELVSASGQRVLGFAGGGAISGESELSPIEIRIGSQVPTADGGAATLTGFQIAENGQVMGLYDDGLPRSLGQLLVARFQNPSGLLQQGENTFAATSASGLPVVAPPGEQGAGTILAGATEQSNVDLGKELVELTLAENQFQTNLLVIHTAGDMLEELMFLTR